MAKVVRNEEFLSSLICQNEHLALSTENTVAPDISAATSSTVRIGWCGRIIASFRSLGSMHYRILSVSFLCVATIEDTSMKIPSVGSEMGVMTPDFTMVCNSVFTLSIIATGTRRGGRTTGVTFGSNFL